MAGAIGNALDWYDFAVYGYFAPIFASQFFPSSNYLTSLVAAFGVFAVGFLMRPLGGVLIGHVGDIYGRRPALILSIVLMAVPTTMIAFLPTFASVGILAPILLTLMRALQGLAASGEYGVSTVFLFERARPGRRAFDTAWTMIGSWVGILLGSATGAAMSLLLSDSELFAWGWRVPFLGGVVLGLAGWYVRRQVQDDPQQARLEAGRLPVVEACRAYWPDMLRVTAMTAWWATSYWLLLVYMTTYLVEFEHIERTLAFEINTANMAILIVVAPFGALLSDKVGRKRVLLAASGAGLVLGLPLFWLMHHPDPFLIWLGQFLFALLLGTYMGGQPAAMAELFPRHVRVSAVSFSYNLGIGLFGGLAPVLVTFLIKETSNDFVPGYVVVAGAAITFFGLLGLRQADREPSPSRVRDGV
ncbi:MAG: MFS transporter [Hyphomicrobiales bacterium]